jgi:AcrR family transcriptional regulator
MTSDRAEATKHRILDAALQEFSEHGVAGARVDRIARTAGCNKNLLYVYFGSKEELFTAVLEQQLAPVYEGTPFTPGDLPDYAGQVFDFAMDRTDLMRLAAWSTLERSLGHRSTSHQDKVNAVAALDNDGPFTAQFVVTAVMALATAWSTALPFGLAMNPDPTPRREELRAQVIEAVRRIMS